MQYAAVRHLPAFAIPPISVEAITRADATRRLTKDEARRLPAEIQKFPRSCLTRERPPLLQVLLTLGKRSR
jgi:hypothetical protein